MFDWIAGIISRLGYAGVVFLTFLENLCPPIPSELVIPMAGYVAAADAEMSVPMVIAAGTFGSLAGAWFWFYLGRRIGERRLREWVDRHGRWLTLSGGDVDRAKDWFQRHGTAAVLLGRLVPGVRTFISLPAGFSRMGTLHFLAYSAIGTLAWTAALAYAGVVLRANFTVVGDYLNIATNVILAAFAAMLVWRYVKCWSGVSSSRKDAKRSR